MYLLGYDIGSSSVKASIIEVYNGNVKASAFYPKQEMKIIANQPGWAEQDPTEWWKNLKLATEDVLRQSDINTSKVLAIGISYQMHGLVCLNNNYEVIRPSIIWCDSRAVSRGERAFKNLGEKKCLDHLLNSPGNFTVSKLAWVKENEPGNYSKIFKILLPGDYIAYKLTGEINTTISGLSEGIAWDFKKGEIAGLLLDEYGIDRNLIPEIVPTFSRQGVLSEAAAEELGLTGGVPVAYRGGDQPNNALSLNVLNPGEIAATAGTSGVIYGVSDEIKYDPRSRVNTFAHVNYSKNSPRLGVLLCVNGTGILNSWLKHNVGLDTLDYPEMNRKASEINIGSDGLCILPFGNGAERMLGNQNPGASIHNLNFNIHNTNHLFRAAQEGIVFAFYHGLEIMKSIGIDPKIIRAGNANMFLSPIFRDTLAGLTNATIELYDTDGSKGAALGAGIGAGIYDSFETAFQNLKILSTIEPDSGKQQQYLDAYEKWEKLF